MLHLADNARYRAQSLRVAGPMAVARVQPPDPRADILRSPADGACITGMGEPDDDLLFVEISTGRVPHRLCRGRFSRSRNRSAVAVEPGRACAAGLGDRRRDVQREAATAAYRYREARHGADGRVQPRITKTGRRLRRHAAAIAARDLAAHGFGARPGEQAQNA
jgi:hypothetical protein